MKILLAVSGSIAFYKAFELISLCKKDGHEVRVLLSDGALKFVSPLGFEALCGSVLTSFNESWAFCKSENLGENSGEFAAKNESQNLNENSHEFTAKSWNLNENLIENLGKFTAKNGENLHEFTAQNESQNLSENSHKFTAKSWNLNENSSKFTAKTQSDKNHINFSRDCDVVIFAPASVNSINKLARGIADTLFLQTLIAASDLPLVIAPAANPRMLSHFATKNALEILAQNGAFIVPSSAKTLACGEFGDGALAQPELILAYAKRAFIFSQEISRENLQISQEISAYSGKKSEILASNLRQKPFYYGKKVIITGGGTREMIDEVRFIGNFSSAKMAKALADAFWQRGAQVVLLSSVEFANTPYEVRKFHASRELENLLDEYQNGDFLIMAAAVSDFVPREIHKGKIKKSSHENGLNLSLNLNKDLLKSCKFKGKKVGFKVEFDAKNALKNAQISLKEKGLNLVCLNVISPQNPAFGSDTNEITLVGREFCQNLGAKSKTALAHDIAAFCEKL